MLWGRECFIFIMGSFYMGREMFFLAGSFFGWYVFCILFVFECTVFFKLRFLIFLNVREYFVLRVLLCFFFFGRVVSLWC